MSTSHPDRAADDKPKCIHCGRPIHRTLYAQWWDIGEVAGWVCNNSYQRGHDAVKVYNKIRERHRKGLIDLSNHVAPPPRPPVDLGDIL